MGCHQLARIDTGKLSKCEQSKLEQFVVGHLFGNCNALYIVGQFKDSVVYLSRTVWWRHARSRIRVPPMLVLHAQVCGSNIGSAARLLAKRSAGVAPSVNLRNVLHSGDDAHKQGIHRSFESWRRHHPDPKQGYQCPTDIADVLQN